MHNRPDLIFAALATCRRQKSAFSDSHQQLENERLRRCFLQWPQARLPTALVCGTSVVVAAAPSQRRSVAKLVSVAVVRCRSVL